jgi:excisionase family DNA binding protein
VVGKMEAQGEGAMTGTRWVAESSPIGERFLTLAEAAEVLRLSARTVREYVRRGEIRGRIIGKRWRFRRADLDAFFENAPRKWDFAGKREDGN